MREGGREGDREREREREREVNTRTLNTDTRLRLGTQNAVEVRAQTSPQADAC